MKQKITAVAEKFKFNGFSLPVKAEVVADSLLNIYKKNHKQLTAHAVVEEARKKQHPLHPCFEWNDSVAGEKYRLHQARNIINCVTLVKTVADKKVEVKAFVNIQRNQQGNLTHSFFSKGESYYISVSDALKQSDTKKYTMELAVNELKIWLNKYKSLNELSEMMSAIEQGMKKLGK